MADLTRIKGNNFVIIGRAGMDFYPDPPGTKTEEASQFFAAFFNIFFSFNRSAINGEHSILL